MLCGFGAAGVVLRFALSISLNVGGFPYGTFLANLVGAFAIGWLYETSSILPNSPQVKLAIAVGFLGALTTFSSYSFELLEMFRNGRLGMAFLYFFLSQSLCFTLCWLGWRLAKSS